MIWIREDIYGDIMSFMYIGERSPELAGLPPAERRMRYLAAARRSYLYVRTWLGLALFLTLAFNTKYLANAIYSILDKNRFDEDTATVFLSMLISIFAWCCLGWFQISAIRKELQK